MFFSPLAHFGIDIVLLRRELSSVASPVEHHRSTLGLCLETPKSDQIGKKDF